MACSLKTSLPRQNIEDKVIAYKKPNLNHSFLVQYAKYDSSEMNSLCDKYGSDKGESNAKNNPYTWVSHNYADFYQLIFSLSKYNIQCVVECGIGTNDPNRISSMGVNAKPGASLRVWRDYFPNAEVIGCDIDSNILFIEDRILTYQCDQTDPKSIKSFIHNAKLHEQSIDIIIDDGLHKFEAGRCFFENMIELLSKSGIYIIEDISVKDMYSYKDYFQCKSDTYAVQFVHLYTPQRRSGGDNRCIVIHKK